MASLSFAAPILFSRWGQAALTGALALLLSLTPLGAWLEAQLSDLREIAWPASNELAPVTVLAIDEPTLDALGPWPWPREQWGRLVKQLHERYQPQVLALDLVFPPGPSPQMDERLARQLALHPIVLGQLLVPRGSVKGLWRGHVMDESVQQLVPETLALASGTLANSPAIARSAAGGHINALLDGDGSLRRYLPVLCWQAECSVSLGLAAVARAFSAPGWRLAPSVGAAGPALVLEGIEHLSVPLPPGGGVHLPWQRYRAIPVVSLGDAVQGRVDPRLLNDRLLLIGSTAPGLADHVVSPVLTQMPGVMAHALIASAIVENRLPGQPPWAWAAILMLYGAVATLVLARPWGAAQLLGVGLVGMTAMASALVLAYHLADWLLPVAAPSLGLTLLILVQLARVLRLSNQDLVRRMTAYLPEPLVRRLSQSVLPPPQVAWSTLLYADTVAYTVAAQQLRPEELADWVNTGLDIVIRLVERHGGVIDNIAGDGLLAYWDQGSPAQQADRAVWTALVACRALRTASASLRARGLPILDMGMGLHAGPVLVGSFGVGNRRRYTVHGEAANLAHRIQNATRRSNYRLLLSHTLADIQTRYHAASTDSPLTLGNATVTLYTLTRKKRRREF